MEKVKKWKDMFSFEDSFFYDNFDEGISLSVETETSLDQGRKVSNFHDRNLVLDYKSTNQMKMELLECLENLT